MSSAFTTHRVPVASIRRAVVRPILACLLVLVPLGIGSRHAPPAGAFSLGGGTYRVTASVFGDPADGLVGNETSSGHVLAPFDRLVALPACTESSCPWVPVGTGPEGRWGPQTACAEADGLCWVEVVSLDTGACTVAPVLDRGPLFVEDNWWDLRADRSYYLKRGLPAAEATRDGADVGFGRGFSDRGYDVEHVYDYAAAIDLAAGTWVDLGLDVDQGIADVQVTLLWQAGISHWDACYGNFGNAATTDNLYLRARSSTGADALDLMGAGSRVGIIGGQQDGFYPVVYDGQTGWAYAGYVEPDGGNAGDPVGLVTERLNLRDGPSTADDVIRRMAAGRLTILTGDEQNGFLSVAFGGDEGWAYAAYLDTGDGTDGGGGGGDSATTTDRLNLRSGPSIDDDVITVMPEGAKVSLTGDETNGFFGVVYGGTFGWAYGAYLSTVRTVSENLNLRTGPSLDNRIILVMPAGAHVALTGDEQNGFVSVTYGGTDGWAYSAYLE